MLIKVKETCKCPRIRPCLPLYFPPVLCLSGSHTWEIFITLAIPSLLMNALILSPFLYKEPHEVQSLLFLSEVTKVIISTLEGVNVVPCVLTAVAYVWYCWDFSKSISAATVNSGIHRKTWSLVFLFLTK